MLTMRDPRSPHAALTATDLFCGAGGSSEGFTSLQYRGEQLIQVVMAANHWDLAIKTHQDNFPDTDHDCADISQVDFRRYPATDLLWGSPECTNHSQAKGKKRRGADQLDIFGADGPDDSVVRSRATMWDIPRALEIGRLRGRPYKGFVTENVVEVRDWMFWRSWWMACTEEADYCCHFVSLNSMHAQGAGMPAPQSRDRGYIVGHLKGIPCPNLEKWTSPLAYCGPCGALIYGRKAWKNNRTAGRYRQQYIFVCPNSGCGRQVEPVYLPASAAIDWSVVGERIGDRRKPLAEKTMARIDAGLRKFARPITLEAAGNTFERRPGVRSWPVDAPLTTLHTTASKALAAAPAMLVPAGGTWNDGASPVTEPMRARTTRADEGLLVPVEGRDAVQARPTSGPMRAQTARLQDGLVQVPPFLLRHYTPRGNLAQMATSVDAPAPTQTASFVPSLVVPLRHGSVAKTTSSPLDTITTTAHHALVEPFIAELRGGGSDARAVSDPMATVTASGNHHGLVQPDGMVMRNNGSTGDGGEHCTSVEEALRTLTSKGHQSLVTWDDPAVYAYDTGALASPAEPLPTQTTRAGDALVDQATRVEDCLFRMLEPGEIGAGMAFPATYRVLGTKRDRVKQYGNAVTPPAARDLMAALAEVILGIELDRFL